MKRQAIAGLVMGLSLLALPACFDKIDIFSSASAIQAPAGTPTPSPVPPGCEIVAISVSASPDPVQVGSASRLDATPVGANGALNSQCPVLPIAWEDPSGTAACKLVGSKTSYNPSLLCTAGGAANLAAKVGNIVGAATFEVK